MEQQVVCYPILSEKEIEARLNPDDPDCPFYTYVGNRKGVEDALDLLYSAFERELDTEEVDEASCDRLCPLRLALLGPASVGKTTFARLLGQTVELPYCEVVADEIDAPMTLFERLEAAFEAEGGMLVQVGEYQGRVKYELPPMMLFIDEIGMMPKRTQEGFLKMLESKDAMWLFDGLVVDCRRLAVIVATTSWGRMGDAFKTRFDRITLERHTTAELAQIVQNNVKGWQKKWYMEVAKLCPIPREAIKFAEAVVAAARRRRLEIPAAIKLVAERKGIHEGGVTMTAVKVLKLLVTEPNGLSAKSICKSLGIEESEFENDVKTSLLANEYHPAYIEVDGKQVITDAGRKFLEQLK